MGQNFVENFYPFCSKGGGGGGGLGGGQTHYSEKKKKKTKKKEKKKKKGRLGRPPFGLPGDINLHQNDVNLWLTTSTTTSA